MKRKIILNSIICLLLLSGIGVSTVKAHRGFCQEPDPFASLKGYTRARVLKTKTGELLGYIYVKENNKFTNGVLTDLLVVKDKGLRLDTLYHINSAGFFNAKGKTELKNYVKGYYGFRLHKQVKIVSEVFSIGYVDMKGKMYSDDNDYLIDWNDKTKVFEYYPMP